MICELCKGKGWVQGQAPGIPTACSACGGKGFVDMTNDEWRRTCSTEEFAEWIVETFLPTYGAYWVTHDEKLLNPATWVDWLKEKHNG